jgi:hypothetical protein
VKRIVMAAALAAATASPVQAQYGITNLGEHCLEALAPAAGCALFRAHLTPDYLDLWVRNTTILPAYKDTRPWAPGGEDTLAITIASFLDEIRFDLPGITGITRMRLNTVGDGVTIGDLYDPADQGRWQYELVGDRIFLQPIGRSSVWGLGGAPAIHGCNSLDGEGIAYRTCVGDWVRFQIWYEGVVTASVTNLSKGHYTYVYFPVTDATAEGLLRCNVGFGCESHTVTPEPVSMLLLGTGLLGLAAVRRRRK